MRLAFEDRYLSTGAMPCVVNDFLVNFKQEYGEDAAKHVDLLWSRFDRLLAGRGGTMRTALEIYGAI